jgi:ribosomal protein L11 methyltransferase
MPGRDGAAGLLAAGGLIRLALRVPAAQAEMVLAELLELAPAGVEETELPRADGERALVEYALYGAPGELPQLPDLQAAVGGVPVEVSTSEVADDWSERWKRFHRPVMVHGPGGGPALHVRPPWHEPVTGSDDVQEIVIDPGQAFGTGAHASTHLCLELLLALAVAEQARGPAIDVGAGSGVLAIAAARLGYAPVLALDNERESVEAVKMNARVNGVQVQARRFDLRRQLLPSLDGEDADPGRRTPVVLANLLRPLLLDLAASIECPPKHLIASGLLREEADEVADAFAAKLGLRERERRERGEWAALWLSCAPR